MTPASAAVSIGWREKAELLAIVNDKKRFYCILVRNFALTICTRTYPGWYPY